MINDDVINVNLTKEERDIIIDFILCAKGEGYRGGGQFEDIKNKLRNIFYKLNANEDDIEEI